MSAVERPVGSGKRPTRDSLILAPLRRIPALVEDELAARFGAIDWVLLAILVGLPIAFIWHFASPSYFFADDFVQFHSAHTSRSAWSYAFAPIAGYLAPIYSLTYLFLERVAPMNFEVALAILVACHALSAILLQRILTLLFGRVWWTYALALAWAISAVYLPPFTWFAAGLHSIPAITAALASIHGYLCWYATGRRAWLVWSLVAMSIGLGVYIKALLIPLYLVLMRLLLLEPMARLRDSLGSVRDEWRVWLAYVAVCAVFLLGYLLGDYSRPESDATVGEVLRYLRVFWFEGFSPMIFGVGVSPHAHGDLDSAIIVGAQAALIGLVVWSVARRRAAWRAWAFLLVAVTGNALFMVGRVSQLGPELTGYTVRYYTEAALLVPLAIVFAFAVPRLRVRDSAVGSAAPAAPTWLPRHSGSPAEGVNLRPPTVRVGSAALVALALYGGATWGTAKRFSNPTADHESQVAHSGRFARAYIDNLRASLAAIRHTGVQSSLLDHDVPESVIPQFNNLESLRTGVRYTLLSSVVPLFDEEVTFNQPGRLHMVRSDGHLQLTRFVPAAGGSPAELRRGGRLRVHEAHVERRRGEWCVVAEGLGALEWEPRPHLRGRDWWLRVQYRANPAEPLSVHSDSGVGWTDEGRKLPAMGFPGTAIVNLSELPEGVPTNAGVRIGAPPYGRLCVRSLEVGYFDPPAPSPTGEAQAFEQGRRRIE